MPTSPVPSPVKVHVETVSLIRPRIQQISHDNDPHHTGIINFKKFKKVICTTIIHIYILYAILLGC